MTDILLCWSHISVNLIKCCEIGSSAKLMSSLFPPGEGNVEFPESP